MEFGRYPDGTVTKELFEEATLAISDYLISFSANDRSSGSASLVRINGKEGFLTAAHVVDDILATKRPKIPIICAMHLHQLLLDKAHVNIVRHGPPKKRGFPGPDLAFVEICDPVVLGQLKKKKSFYPINASFVPLFEQINPKPAALCFVGGAPDEKSKTSGVRGTSSHVLTKTHFVGRTQFVKAISKKGFEYLKFSAFAGKHGFPSNYEGVSGGGLWHIPLEIDPDVGASSLRVLKPELIGVVFYQYSLNADSRQLLAHSYRSFWSAIVR
jgi:hypothetical protein